MRPLASRPTLLIASAVLATVGVGVGAATAQGMGQSMGTIRAQTRSMVRVAPPPVERDTRELEWKERKAAKCQPLRSIAAALGTGDRHMDVLLRDGTRMRARFAKGCRGQDFYAGFYAEPSADGLLCAGRDSVRARSGLMCRIDRFRGLSLDD